MQVQQADLNVCMGNHIFFAPAQPQELLRRKFRNWRDNDGVIIIGGSSIVSENSQICLDLVLAFLSR